MPQHSAEALDTLKLINEHNLLDESNIRLLEQLFSYRMNSELINTLISGKESKLAVAFFKIINGSFSPTTIGYVLRFWSDIVYFSNTMGEQLGNESVLNEFNANPAETFLRLVTVYHDKPGIVNPSLFLLATAIRYGNDEKNNAALETFFNLAQAAFSADVLHVHEIEFVVQACTILARRKSLRYLFFENDLIRFIPRLLTDIVSQESGSIIQQIYETLYFSWLISFEYEGIVLLQQNKLIPHLHRVLQRVQKEKCIRVALLILKNMIQAERLFISHTSCPTSEWVDPHLFILGRLENKNGTRKGPSLIAEMVGIGMLKTLAQLCRRKFGDEDISILVKEINEALEQSMETLTSFSEYRGEVRSGFLDWTPVHTCSKFWQENVQKFEENNYEVPTELGKIIMDTRNELTLAVACHDLGEIVRYHPTGRNLLTLPQLEGVKERVMSLMSHSNAEVAKNALLAVQKIMVQRWEYIHQG